MLKRYIMDFTIINLTTFLISVIIYIYGRDFANTFMVLLFLESAVALTVGGIYGSIISSASFHGLDRLFRRSR